MARDVVLITGCNSGIGRVTAMRVDDVIGTNIKGADLHTKDGTVFGTIFVEVDNLPHLGKVMKAVRKVKGVTGIERRDVPGS